MNKQTLVILEAIMLILWIITVIVFCIVVFSDGAKCKANPLIYGVNYLGEKNNANLTCSCVFSNEPEFEMIVTKDKWTVQPIKYDIEIQSIEYEQINTSLI